MKKIILVLFVILFISSTLYLVSQNRKDVSSEKISVVTTLFPLYDAALNIGGDKAFVTNILPPGIEAHSFEPKPSDVTNINEADIFVYTGPFMEVWVSDILKGISKNVKVVDSSRGALLIEGDEHEHEHEHEDEESGHEDEEADHEHEQEVDPHFWLDFDNMEIIAKNILDAYIQADPANEAFYRNNFEDYVLKISDIKDMYETTLSNCSNKNIVYGGHFAFNYQAKKYSMNYYSAQGFSPDSEPSAKDLVEIVKLVKEKNVKAIFYEELSSPKIAETIAKETGAELLLLNGAHNLSKEDEKNGVGFFDIMKANLHNLAEGLNCKNE